MSTADQGFMRLAFAQARMALEAGEVPVGAVVVWEGDVIASSHNLRQTLGDPTAHAEILALREAARRLGGWRLSGCRLYVTLEPCPMCAGAIALARPDMLVYGAFDSRAGCAGSVYEICGDRRFGPGVPVIGGVLEERCAALLSCFFEGKRE